MPQSKDEKRDAATARQKAHDKLTTTQKLEKLDASRQWAAKERTRLGERLAVEAERLAVEAMENEGG